VTEATFDLFGSVGVGAPTTSVLARLVAGGGGGAGEDVLLHEGANLPDLAGGTPGSGGASPTAGGPGASDGDPVALTPGLGGGAPNGTAAGTGGAGGRYVSPTSATPTPGQPGGRRFSRRTRWPRRYPGNWLVPWRRWRRRGRRVQLRAGCYDRPTSVPVSAMECTFRT
jgi:hypothetical protein